MEAVSLQAARDALKEMNLSPEEVHESTASEQLEFSPPPLPDSVSFPAASSKSVSAPKKSSQTAYFPFVDTMRLYAGWLIAWYTLVYAFGSFQHSRSLPYEIPYLEGLFLSPLVLSFTFGAFLFLMATGIWKILGKGWLLGIVLMMLGVAAFVLFRMNVL